MTGDPDPSQQALEIDGRSDPSKGLSAVCVPTPGGQHLPGTSGTGTIPRCRTSRAKR